MREDKRDSGKNEDLAIFTVVSNNYLHFARTLLQTAAVHHPNVALFCVIVDKDLGPSLTFPNEFSVLSLEDLNIPCLEQMIFQYDVLELNTAVKPWAFEAILRRGFKSVIYFDPDIFVYRPINYVTEALDAGMDIVITPHLLSPIVDDKRPTELDIRRAGTYNFGFCAVRNSENTCNFLRWWQSKLYRDCIVDLDRGIFVDQSWIDLVPGLFDRVLILRDPSYNVAYWNIGQRVVAKSSDSEWTVDGAPLTFFHFSGFNPLAPLPFSKHQDRFSLATLGVAADLVYAYAEALIHNGAKEFSQMRYGYSTFADGSAIPATFRRFYRNNDVLRREMGDDPHLRSEYLTNLAEGEDIAARVPLTWTMLSLYDSRPDLQAAFNILTIDGASNFWNWIISDRTGSIPESVQNLHRKKWLQGIPLPQSVNQRCFDIFANLLSRNPKDDELKQFEGMCRTKFGATLALVLLATRPESRKRPRPTRRFKKALRELWRAVDSHEVTSHEVGSNESARSSIASGMFLGDSDCSQNGIWCGRCVSIPLGKRARGVIRISGTYFPDFLGRKGISKPLTLNLKLDGKPWKSVTLAENGFIDIVEELPASLLDVRSLQIDADAVFVPVDKGLGDDSRELSWRLKALTLDGLKIVDSESEQKIVAASELFRPEGFNLIGYVFAELGVGEAARTMARAANAASIPYSLCDVGFQTENRQSDMSAQKNAVETTFDIDILYVNADQTANTLSYLETRAWPLANYRIGFWHWEQPRLPEEYWAGFEGLNEVWVPTTFVQDAVSAVSPLPVFKVPHAIEFSVDARLGRRSFGIPEDKFAVLVMYDFDSYRIRKNPEAAIAAFKIASMGRKDTVLVIKTINAAKYASDYAALKEEVAGLDSVVFIDEFLSRDQIYALESNCDCMLSLHRAEGFGFGPAEMMFLGKPVIATGWSGNMDFMTSENSFPVQFELKPLPDRVGAYSAGLDWAEPDIEHAAFCLRSLLEDKNVAREIGGRAAYSIRKNFSPDAVGRLYLDRLTTIRRRF